MENLLFTLEKDWQRFKGRKEIEILDRYVIHGRTLTMTYAGELFVSSVTSSVNATFWNEFSNFSFCKSPGCLYGSMLPFMIIPAVPIFMDLFIPANETRTRLLMFRVDFLLDVEKYYYPLLIHSYFGTMAYITLVVAIDTILMIYVLHACGSFAILGWAY